MGTVSAKKVVDLARSQVGYHEGFSNGHWNNIEHFAPQVPGLEWAQGQAWCDVFVNWCFYKAGQSVPPGVRSAGCIVSCNAWKKAKRFSEYPAVGAQVFFGPGGTSHTGLVEAYDRLWIYTIEGNTNTNGSAEGDGVYRKKRLRRTNYVYGYGYPQYAGPIVSADPKWGGYSTGKV